MPEDYDLAQGERLNEAIAGAWDAARASGRPSAGDAARARASAGVSRDARAVAAAAVPRAGLRPADLPAGGRGVEGRRYRDLPPGRGVGRRPADPPRSLRRTSTLRSRATRAWTGRAAALSPHGLVQEFLNRTDAPLGHRHQRPAAAAAARQRQPLPRRPTSSSTSRRCSRARSTPTSCCSTCCCTAAGCREPGRPVEECWLERWRRRAAEQRHARPRRAARRGRDGDRRPRPGASSSTRPTRRCASGCERASCRSQDYYRQLLRLVYRLLFLFVAEDRDLLFAPDADPRQQSGLRATTTASAGCATLAARAARPTATTTSGTALQVALPRAARRGDRPELGLRRARRALRQPRHARPRRARGTSRGAAGERPPAGGAARARLAWRPAARCAASTTATWTSRSWAASTRGCWSCSRRCDGRASGRTFDLGVQRRAQDDRLLLHPPDWCAS